MRRKHFEYMAATIAEFSALYSESRAGMLFLATELGRKFNERFDETKLHTRIAEYDNGERCSYTYLNNH